MLSIGIITYNEELRLKRTLESVKNLADEIVIVDSFSTDKTIEIAQQFNAKIFQISWPGYGLQKNNVIERCTGDWILLIDADEVIVPKLATEIENVINLSKYNVFEIPFNSVCFGKRIKYGGWSGSYRVRLFKKNSGVYSTDAVHEKFLTKEKIGKLKNRIDHYTYEDFYDYLHKFNRYTNEGAQVALNKNKSSGFFNIIINPIFKFLRMYIFRLGILDGIEGLFLSIFSALYTSVKYLKLRKIKKELKKELSN